MEDDAVESNEVKTSRTETREVGPEEAEVDRLQNGETNMHETEAGEALTGEERSENPPEEADSEGTEETGSERTNSEAADTAPSDIEVEFEDDQDRKAQAEEAQNEEVEGDEFEGDEYEGEDSEGGESEDEGVQPGEGRTRSFQAEEAQTKNPLTGDAPINNAKTEEYEAKVSENERAEAEAHEPKNVTWPESEPASDKVKVPTPKPSTTDSTEGSLAMKQSSDLEHPDPKAPKHAEIPTGSKGKGLATTDTPMLNEPRYYTPQEIQEDIIEYNKNGGLVPFFPKESSYIPIMADNGFKFGGGGQNLLDWDADTPGIAKYDHAQMKDIQTQEVHFDDIQDERAQTKEPQTEEAQTQEAEIKESGSDAGSEELEKRKIEIDDFAPKEPESKSVKWAETKAKVAAETSAAQAPIAMTRDATTPTTRRSRMKSKVETAVAGGSGKVSDTEECDSGSSDSEDSDCETPINHKERGIRNPDASVPTKSRLTTREKIRADITNFIDESDLSSFFPDGSPYLDTVVKNAANFKKKKENKAKNDAHMQSISRLNIYQPVLYCGKPLLV
jgi:hypothetical protein